jgi:ribose-phosphate pyrophosphokinase
MVTLNLLNKDLSDIPYREGQYPDSQQYVIINCENMEPFESHEITIVISLQSFRDLERLIFATHALREIFTGKIHVFISYFLGARSDRRFIYSGNEVDTNYLKNVICPIINLQNYSSVFVLDPHSNVLEACLNNFCKTDNSTYVGAALFDIAENATKGIALVAPDAGAEKKVTEYAKEFHTSLITASKVRDLETGNIVSTTLHNFSNDIEKFVIVDDICDGGRTFIELAKAIIAQCTEMPEIYLIVTHGIFSNGFEELSKYFKGIYTTDSFYQSNKEIDEKYNVVSFFCNELI